MSQSPEESTPGKRLPKSKSVLVIAAADPLVKRWKKELETAGYGVECVENGMKGLDILYGFSFDALLIDDGPEINGMDLAPANPRPGRIEGAFHRRVRPRQGGPCEPGNGRARRRGQPRFPARRGQERGNPHRAQDRPFPARLSAQPRAKQAAPASPLDKNTLIAAGTSAAPAPTADDAPASDAPTTTVAPARTVPFGAGQSSSPRRVHGDSGEQKNPHHRRRRVRGGHLPLADRGGRLRGGGRARRRDRVPRPLHASTRTRCCSTCCCRAVCRDRKSSRRRARRRSSRKSRSSSSRTSTRATWRRKPRRPGCCACSTRRRPRRATWSTRSTKFSCPAAPCFGGRRRSKPSSSTCRRWRVAAGSSAPLADARGAAPARPAADDGDFQAEIRESLLQGAPDFVKSLRGLLQVLLRSQGDPAGAGRPVARTLHARPFADGQRGHRRIPEGRAPRRGAGGDAARVPGQARGAQPLDQAHAHAGGGFPGDALHRRGHPRERQAAQRANPRRGRRNHQPPRHRAFAGKSGSEIHRRQPPRRGSQAAPGTALRPRVPRRGNARHERLRALQEVCAPCRCTPRRR